MADFATFGEIMLRLSPPGRDVLFRTPRLVTAFGGAEANVAVSLALLGHRVRFVSAVPANEAGDAALRELRKWGVDTTAVVRAGRRLGIYFAETGANQRAGKVLYDRDGSSLAEAKPGAFEWRHAFGSAAWFHMTGVTPALSASAAELSLEALKAAKAMGLKISLDINYRAKLWKYGRSASGVMRELAAFADVLIGNEEDFQKSLGIEGVELKAGRLSPEDYGALTSRVMSEFPGAGRVAVTLRSSFSADHNGWSAVLRNREAFLVGPSYEIGAVVDRIGAGDAFAAGLLHGLATSLSDAEALAFAAAASCLKHGIPGDFNLATEKDIAALAAGDRSGRVRR